MPDLTKAEKDKISRNEQEDKAFAEMIDKFKSGKMKSHEVLRVGTSPYCLRLAGADPIPVKIRYSVLVNSTSKDKSQVSNRNKRRHTDPHAVSYDLLKQLPSALRNPLFIVKGQRDGTIGIVLDTKDEKGHNLFLGLNLNTNRNCVYVSTIVGRKNAEKILDDAVKNNTLIAINKKVAEPKLTNNVSPANELLATICYDDSIAYTDKNVKTLGEVLTEISQDRVQESKGEKHMPVQEQQPNKQQEEKPFELDERKPTSFEQSGKLIPILEAKAEFHQGRIDTIDEKIARREDKISRNEDKIDKLNEKADKLEALNETLKTVAANNPLAQALVEKNEKKIAEIRNELIPKREANIEKHKEKISALSDKRRTIEHKLDRTVALSKTISSFALFGAERRELFKSAIDDLHKSTIACLNDRISAMEEKQSQLGETAKAGGMDGLKARRKIDDLSDKIDKLKAKVTAYATLDDAKTDKLMEHTAETISQGMEHQVEKISLAEIAENAAVESAEFTEHSLGLNADRENLLSKRDELQAKLDAVQYIIDNPHISEEMKKFARSDIEKITPQIEEIDKQLAEMPEFNEPENALKNAELSAEGNTNMIDGIINNGADSQEIAGVYDDVERAADEQARTANNEPDVKINAEQFISELESDGRANADFYKTLPKEDRTVSQSLTMDDAKKVITALAAQNVDMSAVVRKNGMVAITTDKKDAQALNAEIAKTFPQKQQAVATPQRDGQQTKKEVSVHNESVDNARKIVQELRSQGIPCKAQKRSGMYGEFVTIAIPKEHEAAYKQVETAVKTEKAEFINPDFYKTLPKQERFTQRMDAEQARKAVSELTKQGVQHSAVIDGKNSAVTIAKKDKPKFPFAGVKRGNVKKRIQTYQQEHKNEKSQEKANKKNKGIGDD